MKVMHIYLSANNYSPCVVYTKTIAHLRVRREGNSHLGTDRDRCLWGSLNLTPIKDHLGVGQAIFGP